MNLFAKGFEHKAKYAARYVYAITLDALAFCFLDFIYTENKQTNHMMTLKPISFKSTKNLQKQNYNKIFVCKVPQYFSLYRY